jgi:hypothetical protein
MKISSAIKILPVFICCAFSEFIGGLLSSNVPDINAKKLTNDERKIFQLEKSLRMNLRMIENKELEILIVKDIVDSWTYIEEFVEVKDEVNRIARSINDQIEPAKDVLSKMCTFLTNKEHKNEVFFSLLHPCPNHDNIEVKIKHFYNEIYQNLTSEMNFEHLLSDRNLIFSNYLKEIIRKSHNLHSSRQYFLSTSDHGKIENCNNVPEIPQFMKIYFSSIVNKTTILLFDQTTEQMEVSKNVAKKFISSLNEKDKITLILISDKVSFFTTSKSCQNQYESEYLYNSSSEIKTKIYDFIDSINRTNEIANHTLIFETAFDVISKIYGNSDEKMPISLLYISEGVANSFIDTKNVLNVINTAQSRLAHPVIINICAITGSRPFPTQTQFLLDISSQDYEKFGINSSNWIHRHQYASLRGQMFLINKDLENLSRNLMLSLAELYNYKTFIEQKILIHEPYHDAFSKDNVISISKTCDQKGIFAMDLYLNDLIKEIYSNDMANSYKFLVLKNGQTIAHSKRFPVPLRSKSLQLVDINLFEDFNDLWNEQIKVKKEGNAEYRNLTYSWKHISDLMIVCIVTEGNEKLSYKSLVKVKKTNLQVNDLIYHRLDLVLPSSLNYCQYYKQTVTFDAVGLHLSSRAFISPFDHVSNMKHDKNYNSQIIQNFIAYLRDTKNLFANPGLQKNVKNEVFGIYQIMEMFKKKHLESDLSKYVIRRYVASPNGILEMFPACSIDENFEVTNRPWFIKAIENPQKVIVTEPYLDAAGADYIVSVSYAIRDARSKNSSDDQAVIIISLDFTRGFFYKLLLNSLPECNDENIKCFLMSENGFLIAHPKIIEFPETMTRRHPEHLTHLESFVANDILMQKKFVEKISCNNYFNGTSQRFYKFNTSINEVITNFPNFASFEKTKYQILNVRDTNLFIGIINSTAEASGAFCPCSTIDFRCLNCLRMEQIECECPCECRLNNDNNCSTNETIPSTTDSMICPKPIENIYNQNESPYKDTFETCSLFHCDMFTEKEDCLGVIGCTW